MPTKETNPCENAVSCGELALGLALAPRTVRVDLNKLKKLSESRQGWCYESVLHYAIEGFLAQGSPEMSHELFGRIISEYRADPHDILSDPPKQETTPTPRMVSIHRGSRRPHEDDRQPQRRGAGLRQVLRAGHRLPRWMQAISYTAHMCYKMVQQRSM